MSTDQRSFALGVASGAMAASLATIFMMRRTRVGNGASEPGSCVRVDPPNPEWKPGDKQPGAFESSTMVTIDPTQVNKYSLMISAYTPRPIALCSTISPEGVVNVSPFSYSGNQSLPLLSALRAKN
jgi:hypothetical protein